MTKTAFYALWIAGLAFAIAPPCHADSLYYLTPEQLSAVLPQVEKILPRTVAQANADLKNLEKIRAKYFKDGKSCGAAQYFQPLDPDDSVDLARFFGKVQCASGPEQQQVQDALNVMIQKVVSDVHAGVAPLKKSTKDPITGRPGRDRPYVDHARAIHQLEASLSMPACVKTVPEKDHQSFPSFHAAMSEAMAQVLSRIFPAQRKQFKERAEEIRISRNVLAVHYPTDVQAGEVLADKVFDDMMKCDPKKKANYCLRTDLQAFPNAKGCSLPLVSPEEASDSQSEIVPSSSAGTLSR